MLPEPTELLQEFIRCWSASGAAERANYQLFLSELCDTLHIQRPELSRPDNALNTYVFERAVVFQNGYSTIRWLRPEYQNWQTPTQTYLGIEVEQGDTVTPATKAERMKFPKNLAEQARAVRNALAGENVAVTAEQLSAKFKARKNLTERISELLQTLALLGQAREVEENKYLV